VDAFEGGANGALGTKEKKFAEMAQHGEYSHDAREVKGALERKAVEKRKSGADGADTNLRKERSRFAAHSFDVEMFDKDSAGITASGGQAQEAAGEVIIFDATNVMALVGESFGDGVVEGHALFARVERSGGEGAVKAARSDGKMAGIGLDEADHMAEVFAGVRTRKLIGGGSDAGAEPRAENAQRVKGEVHSQDGGSHLCQKHGESSVTTANFQNPAASGTQCVEMRGNLEKVA